MALSLLDLRVAVRRALASKTLLCASVVSLGLGMGGVAVVYEMIDALLLHPFPTLVDPSRVVHFTLRQDIPREISTTVDVTSYPTLLTLRRIDAFDHIAGVFDRSFDDPRKGGASVRVALVSDDYFSVLATPPLVGRSFSEGAANASPVAVIGEGYWRRAFGGRVAAVGSRLRLGSHSLTIIGVMPFAFRGDELTAPDVWVPLGAVTDALEPGWQASGTGYWLRIVGLLRSHVSRPSAEAQVTSAVRGMAQQFPEGGTIFANLPPLSLARGPDGGLLPEAHLSLWLASLAALVLIMAAFNIATMQLTRAVERRAETATRIALGADFWRLARTTVVETLVVCASGAAGGVVVVVLLNHWIRSFMPGLVVQGSLSSVLRVTVVLILLTGVVSALVACLPIWALRRNDIGGLLRVQGHDRGVGAVVIRVSLLCTQVAVGVVLVGVAEAFARSFERAHTLDLGMDAPHVVVAQLDVRALFLTPEEGNRLFLDLSDRVKALGGVLETGVSTSVPFLSADGLGVFADGNPYPLDINGSEPYFNAVSPTFFAAIGAVFVRGRPFNAGDRQGSPRVAVVSQSLVDHAWPSADPIGRCLHLGIDTAPCTRVVGVLKGGRLMRLKEDPRAFVYLPLAQSEFQASRRVLVVRTADPGSLIPRLSRELVSSSPALEDAQVVAMQDVIAPQWRQWSLAAIGCSMLAFLGLGLAAFGVYGAVSMQVSTRAPELAVRAAIGASPSRLVLLCARTTLMTTGTGLVLGTLALVLMSRPLAPLLFETTVAEPSGVVAPCLLLLGVATLALTGPAMRIVRTDLATLLRTQ